jgi:hypothetical protein
MPHLFAASLQIVEIVHAKPRQEGTDAVPDARLCRPPPWLELGYTRRVQDTRLVQEVKVRIGGDGKAVGDVDPLWRELLVHFCRRSQPGGGSAGARRWPAAPAPTPRTSESRVLAADARHVAQGDFAEPQSVRGGARGHGEPGDGGDLCRRLRGRGARGDSN